MKTTQIHHTAIIDDGAQIGENTAIWHFSHIMSGAVVGQNCVVGQNVFIASDVAIGNGVKIQNNVSVFSGVICEDDVFLGPCCVFTNVISPRSAISRKNQFLKTLIKKGASIGANATIICGNTIGEYAMIGAGSVITKDVPPYALIVGNPGKQIGWVSEYGNRLEFDENNIAVCEESGKKYKLENSSIHEIN